MKPSKIAISRIDGYMYPNKDTLFRPSYSYPEYPFKNYLAETENSIYDTVRNGFKLLNLDIENFGSTSWNPLKTYVFPGDNVLIKPNMVMDYNASGGGTDCLYTNPSVVACVVDFIIIALRGKGHIVIADAPMQECNFDKLIEESGYSDLIRFYNEHLPADITIELKDLRGLISVPTHGVYRSKETGCSGTVIDLGKDSEFAGGSDYLYENMRITNYDPAILKSHHNQNKNEYYIANDCLKADVIINMPKPKTHRKAGVTISLKNMVGINSRKEYLPHHVNGEKSKNGAGDEYKNKSKLKEIENNLLDRKNYLSQTKRAYKRAFVYQQMIRGIHLLLRYFKKDSYKEGSWYGNTTISRTIVDLNKIIFYADKQGKLQEERQRRYFIVADMIVSGEKEGPVIPSPKKLGIIAMGDDPVSFDEIIGRLMGAKLDYIDTIKRARLERQKYKLSESEGIIVSNCEHLAGKTVKSLNKSDLLYFLPSSGWIPAFEVKDAKY